MLSRAFHTMQMQSSFVGKQPRRLIDGYSNTSACGNQHGKEHLKLLVLHHVARADQPSHCVTAIRIQNTRWTCTVALRS